MKTIPSVTLTIVSLTITSLAQQTRPSSSWSTEYTPSEKGPHYTRWSRLSLTTNEQGNVSLHTNTFVQLRTGLNRWTGTEWAEASPELIVTNNGILGRGAQHSAFFSSDLAGSRAPVRIWSPNGQTLAFRILGLAYHDVATGTNILLAAPKSSATQLIGTNSVWYVDALDDIKCDIRYLYSADGVRQHVVIRECPEPPTAYGLSNATTHLLVISELIDGPALQVSQRSWAVGRETDNDQTLDFSSMRMVPGRAFSLRDPEPGRGTRVTKQYETVGDRRLIVERVRYSQVRDDLMRLPPAGMLMTNAPGVILTNAAIQKRARWYAQGTVPPVGKGATVAAARSQPAQRLAALSPKPGFVVDWELVDTVDWTFDSCYTYVISGECHLASARFQSAVIKYDMGSSLYVDGPLLWMDYGSCNSGSAAQLTSVNDDQIGEQIPWSTHQPAWGDYGPALVVQPQDLSTALQHMGCLYGCAYGEQCIIAGDPVLPIVSITASDSLATKGTSDSGAYTITRQYGDWRQPLPVQVSVGGTAVPNQDYVQITSPITIPANQQSVTVNVTPLAPSGVRYESTVILTLEPQPGYVVGAPSSATVFVDDPSAAPLNIVLAPSGLMDWWRGENDFTDSAGSMPGTPANGLGFAAGEVGQGFNFDGVDDRLCTAAVTPPGPLDFGPNADLSIEA